MAIEDISSTWIKDNQALAKGDLRNMAGAIDRSLESLQTDVNGKAPKEHTHVIDDVQELSLSLIHI